MQETLDVLLTTGHISRTPSSACASFLEDLLHLLQGAETSRMQGPARDTTLRNVFRQRSKLAGPSPTCSWLLPRLVLTHELPWEAFRKKRGVSAASRMKA